MSDFAYPLLCGGTFLTLLLQEKKDPTETYESPDNKEDYKLEGDMFAELTKVVKPKHEERLSKVEVSNFKYCKGPKKSKNIPFHSPSVIDGFDRRVKNEYEHALMDMKNFTDNFIEESSGRWLTEKLLGLINSDDSINDYDKFYMNHNGATQKLELCSQPNTERSIYLPAFLLGVWHFIVTKRQDNTIGKDTIVRWYTKAQKESQREYIGPAKSVIEWNIKLVDVDSWKDTKNSDCIEDWLSSEIFIQDDDFIAMSEQCELAFKNFERVIYENQFVEFIKSEPLRKFAKGQESDAEKFESRYTEYEDRLRSYIAKSLYGDCYEFDMQAESFPYTYKYLTPTLLGMSMKLVDILVREILPAIQALDHPLYDTIFDFKNKLESYNKLLIKHLIPKNEHFVYNFESGKMRNIFNEREQKQGSNEILALMKKLTGKHITSIEDIALDEDVAPDQDATADEDATSDNKAASDEDAKFAELDKTSILMGFHSTTRHLRAVIRSQYEEIWKEIILSPDF